MKEPKYAEVIAEPLAEKLIQLQESLLAMGPDTRVTDVLSAIAEAANDVLGGHFCVVFPYDEQSDTFIMDQVTPTGAREALDFQWTRPRPNGTVRTALKEGMFTAEDYERDVERYPFLAGGPGAFKEVADVRACIGIRLQAGRENVGVLFVNYPEPHPFTEEEKRIAGLFASQAALAIHNVRLYESIVRSAAELESLLDITGDVTSAMADVRLTLQTIIERAVSLIGTTRGAILLYQNGFGTVEVGYHIDPAPPVSIGVKFPTDTPLQVRIKEKQEPVQIEDVATAQFLSEDERKEFKERGIRSLLIIPMVVKGEVIGSIGLDETRRRRSFTAREVELCQILAGHTAIAIENATIYERTRGELDSVLNVGREITSAALDPSLGLEEFFHLVLERSLDLFEFEAGWLLRVEGDWLRIVATDERHRQDEGRPLHIDDSITGLCAKEKKPINILDIQTAEPKYRRLYKDVAGGGMHSELAVPLMVGDTVIGVFNVESDTPNAFSERHEDLLTALAGQVALALELARWRQESSALRDTAIDISQSLEPEETMDSILRRGLELIGGRFGQILLREGDELVVRYATGGEGLGLRPKISKCVSGMAIEQDAPVIIPDVSKEPRYVRVIEATKEAMLSELAVPIKVEDQVIGAFNVESPRLAGFDERMSQRLSAFVGLEAKSIEEAFSHEEQEALAKILRKGLATIGTEFGQILRVDDKDLVIEATTGDEELGSRVEIGDSVTGMAVVQGKPIIIDDVRKEQKYKRFLGEEMKSELVVPLRVGDEKIGVFNVESPRLGYFTEGHARLLESMASQAAIAIRNAQLFDQEERRLEQMEVIHEVGGSITSVLDMDTLLPLVIDLIGERFGYYIAHIFLVDTDSNMAVLTAGSGETGRALVEEGVRLRVGKEGIIGWVAAEGKPLLVNDVSKEARYYPHRLLPHTKAELAVPVKIGDRVIAVLDVQRTEVDSFDESDLFVLETLGHEVGVALENARYIEAEKLAAVGEKSGDIVHRVSGHIGAIRWRVERLREKKSDLLVSDDYLARSLADIERNALKIQGMVRELKEGVPEPLAPFEVWPLLTSALDGVEIPQSIEVVASPDDRLPRVLTNPKLENVFYNLMINAVEAMPDGGRLEITTEVKDEDWVEASIRDTGRGIPDYLLEEIFTASFTTKDEEGHGLGLWWSRAFVEKCGGTIKVQSELGKGSCFTVRLRVAP